MVCVYCGQKTQVVNSRLQRRRNQVWRRRFCPRCGAIFSSTEAVCYNTVWTVKDPSGLVAPFQRDKLFLSLHTSCQHRPSALNDAAGLADIVISKLADRLEDGTLKRRTIFQTALVALNRFDQAASVHYEAFHQQG